MNKTFTSFKDFKQRYPIRPNDEGALLGSGSYGRVIKVEDQLETEWVAIKISEFKGNDTKSLKAEVELAQRVPRQTNIARYDACYRFETDTSISDFAIMKYYPDGNLADLLRRITLSPTQIYEITQGILLGLQHLHRQRIVHRDFKPANILISRDNAGRFIPKIADFGLSKLVRDDELDSSDFDLSDGRGTPSYKAPEQIEGSRVSFNLDLWAFGVILYEIMTGEKPFRADLRNSSEQSARREIEKKIITVELPARINQIAEPYNAIIRRCLVRDIHQRVRKEDELLDLLDGIPHLLAKARTFVDKQQYTEAIALYEQVIAKREGHIEAHKGLEICALFVQKHYLIQLLNEADRLVGQHQFEQAKTCYEQVLQLDPAQEAAVRGLTLCIGQLRPKPLAEPELTDVYQEEKTDVYVASPASVTPKADPKPAPVNTPNIPQRTKITPPIQRSVTPEPTIIQPVVSSPGQTFPWRIVVPVAVGLGGILLYLNLSGSSKTASTQTLDRTSTATVGPPIGTEPKITSTTETTVESVPGESKAALKKRIEFAFSNAKKAYRQQDYDGVITLTNSALLLDPTRRDVARLRDITQKEIDQKRLASEKLTVPDIPVPEAPREAKPAEPEKTKAPEPVAKENSKSAKEEAQEKYDQLIENGLKAVTKNNKEKAIADFTDAHSLVKAYDLSTAKADAAYNTYLAKANRIFDNEEEGGNYEGAKSWYKVAQALKDTPEVRRKIKQCTNQ